MKLPKVNFKKIAMETAGQAGGAIALAQVQKIKFVANAKPLIKGFIYKAIGVFLPGLLGKKGGELVDGAATTFNVAGTLQIINAVKPGMVPAIGNYEDYPISGPGYEMEEGDDSPNVEGYEDNILS